MTATGNDGGEGGMKETANRAASSFGGADVRWTDGVGIAFFMRVEAGKSNHRHNDDRDPNYANR